MSQYYPDEPSVLLKNVRDVGLQLHPGSEDELESLLTWLNPNEIESNHQMRPPALRLKNVIKVLVNQTFNNSFSKDGRLDGVSDLEKEFFVLLRQYYIYGVRLSFFSKFDSIRTFKDIQKLEMYYQFPLKHIYFFQNNTNEWIIERDGLRHYLLNKNVKFREHLKQRLRELIMSDDFDLVWDILLWLNQAQSTSYSKDVLLDLILLKISDFCETNMTNVYDRRFLVMETFNSFILKYWNNFAQFLGCPEDDHGLTTIIYNCFEKQFIRVRIREIFNIFIHNYPDSKPTILEMKKTMVNTDDFKSLVIQFLSLFERKILNPSVTTVAALLAYVKAIKAFLQLDPSGKYLNSVTSFVKSHFQERDDLVIVLLYAILDLKFEEINETTNILTDKEGLRQLAAELRDPDFSIEKLSSRAPSSQRSMRQVHATFPNTKGDTDGLICQEITKSFQNWRPEPTDSLPQNHSKGHRSLLDILMTMFESREYFVSEFLKLLRKQLLTLKFYKLNRNWSKCLKLMKEKLKNKNIQLSSNEPCHNEEAPHSNNMDVMLWDIKRSEELCRKMHQVAGLHTQIFPKFISFLYWNRKLDYKNDPNIEFKLSTNLSSELEKYINVYKELQPGRSLHLCKDQGIVDLELNFKDGRVIKCEATLEQCTTIEQFHTSDDHKCVKLTLEDISSRLAIQPERAQTILKFWIDRDVLYKSGDFYRSIDDREAD